MGQSWEAEAGQLARELHAATGEEIPGSGTAALSSTRKRQLMSYVVLV